MKKAAFLFYFVTTFISLQTSAKECGLNALKDHLLQLKLDASKIEKQAQVDLAKNDSGLFCQNNMILRYLNVNPWDSSSANFQCTEMPQEQLEKYTEGTMMVDIRNRFSVESGPRQPWLNSLIMNESAQKLAYLDPDAADSFRQQIRRNSPNEVLVSAIDAHFEKNLDNQIRLLNESNSETTVFSSVTPEMVDRAMTSRETSADNIALQAGACADFNLSNAIGCTKALKRIQETAAPKFFRNLAYMPLKAWKTLISSEKKYKEGLRLASLKLSQKIKDRDTSGSNIFDDLNESFIKSGMSKEAAVDASYNILALYGNGGANLGARANNLASLKGSTSCSGDRAFNICNYLDIIGKSIPTLDYMNMKKGLKPYSFPKNVDGKCNTNKSYHFWMAAYLSRELTKEGVDAKTASTASYISAVGYQINRDLGVASNSSVAIGANTIKKSTFDPVYNVIRTDLAYAYNGAQFGSQSNLQNLSVDKSLVTLLSHSAESTPDSVTKNTSLFDRIGRYQNFKEVVAPKSLLNEEP